MVSSGAANIRLNNLLDLFYNRELCGVPLNIHNPPAPLFHALFPTAFMLCNEVTWRAQLLFTADSDALILPHSICSMSLKLVTGAATQKPTNNCVFFQRFSRCCCCYTINRCYLWLKVQTPTEESHLLCAHISTTLLLFHVCSALIKRTLLLLRSLHPIHPHNLLLWVTCVPASDIINLSKNRQCWLNHGKTRTKASQSYKGDLELPEP